MGGFLSSRMTIVTEGRAYLHHCRKIDATDSSFFSQIPPQTGRGTMLEKLEFRSVFRPAPVTRVQPAEVRRTPNGKAILRIHLVCNEENIMKTLLETQLHRILALTVVTTLITFLVVGGVLIQAASKKREFSGKLTFKVCRKLPNGQWQEIDKGEGPLRFEASLIEAAGAKQFTSNYVWNGTSTKGQGFSSALQGTGKVTADLTSGKFDLTSVPLKITSGGKTVLANFSLTTETVSAPNGESLSGKRARIVNKQGDIAVVGFSVPVVVNHEEQFTGNKKPADKKKVVEELIFIARAEGKIAAR